MRALRLAFAGTAPFAVPSLDALAASGHEVVAVFTRPDSAKGRGQSLRPSPVKVRAVELGLAVCQPASFRSADTHRLLRELVLDALVVVAYGLILPPEALAIPRLGCFNVHASLLPRWRGAAPIQRSILAGDRQAGVTIMRMEAGLDTGPMLERRPVDLAGDETGGSLTLRLAALGGTLIREAIDQLAAGRSHEEPQPAQGVTYAAKIDKAEACIDWGEDAVAIERKVRAFNPSPVAETRWRSAQLRIWEAAAGPAAAAAITGAGPALPGTVIGTSSDGVLVACGVGSLWLRRLQLPGRKPVGAIDFINAQAPAGSRFGTP